MKYIQVSQRFLFSLIIGFLFFIIFSCKKERIADPDQKKYTNYYPARIGSIWFYDVDSLIFRKTLAGLEIDSIHLYVKEVISDTIMLNNNLFYTLERYEKKDASAMWNFQTIYTLQFIDNKVFRTEENQSFLKLNFPLITGSVWDANSNINKEQEVVIGGENIKIYKGWESKINSIEVPYFNGLINFDSTSYVELADVETLIDVRKGFEIYARNYGLVYRYLEILDTQCNGDPFKCKDIPWSEKADKGFILIQKLTNFKW